MFKTVILHIKSCFQLLSKFLFEFENLNFKKKTGAHVPNCVRRTQFWVRRTQFWVRRTQLGTSAPYDPSVPLKSIMSFYYSILVPPLSPLPGRIISRNYKFLLFNRLENKLTYFSNHQKLPKCFYCYEKNLKSEKTERSHQTQRL